MMYLPTIIGSHAPPTVLASQRRTTAIGTASMNGGTIAMRSSGTENDEREDEHARLRALVRLACASRLRVLGLGRDAERSRP